MVLMLPAASQRADSEAAVLAAIATRLVVAVAESPDRMPSRGSPVAERPRFKAVASSARTRWTAAALWRPKVPMPDKAVVSETLADLTPEVEVPAVLETLVASARPADVVALVADDSHRRNAPHASFAHAFRLPLTLATGSSQQTSSGQT